MKGHGEPLAYGVPNNITTTATGNYNSTLQQHLQLKNHVPKPVCGLSLVTYSCSRSERNAREVNGNGSHR